MNQRFKKKFKGYISSGKIGENFFPQKVQNLCIKSYCESNNFIFLLSSTEFKMKKSILVFKGLIEDSSKFDGIIFFSINQLNAEKLILLNNILKKRKEVHFYLENIKLKNTKDLKKVSLLKKIDQILKVKS